MKKVLKESNQEIYGGNPVVYEDAIESMKNNRKLLKDRMKPAEKAAEEIVKDTATDKVRLQGTKETTGPKLKPYTESFDVVNRTELAKLIEKAKAEKKTYKIARSLKEGFRYKLITEGIEEDKPSDARVDLETGEPVANVPADVEPESDIEPEEAPELPAETEEPLDIASVLSAHLDLVIGEDGSITIKAKGSDEEAPAITLSDVSEEERLLLASVFDVGEEPEEDEVIAEPEDDTDTAEDEIGVESPEHEKEETPEEEEEEHEESLEEAKHRVGGNKFIASFEEAQELSKDTAWDIKDKKVYDDYIAKGVKLYYNDEDGKLLIYVYGPTKEVLTSVEADGSIEEFPGEERVKVSEIDSLIKEIKARDIKEALIEPKKDEKESDFVSRFMGDATALKEFPDEKQRAAVAYSKFKDKKEEVKPVDNKEEQKELKEADGDSNQDSEVLASLEDYEPWAAAEDVWALIVGEDKIEDLGFLLEDSYPDGITPSELNDMLSDESDWVLAMLGINREKVVSDSDEPFIADDKTEDEYVDDEPEPVNGDTQDSHYNDYLSVGPHPYR